ncbi:MAG: cupin domain-containing protein [Gaiella sp.]
MTSPFRTWNGVEPFAIFPNVELHAIGGEQMLMCRVRYEPGKTVGLHSHEFTEQVMWLMEGTLEMTIAGETRQMMPGDTCVINKGIEHELHTETGCVFLEGLAPVPLDHVPDRERDLVLGELGGSLHVER